MKKKLTLALGSTGLALAFGFLSFANAQNAPQSQSPAPTERGMMGGMGGMQDMMGMMAQMKRMMDQCERMMQAREQQQPAPPDRNPR